MNVFLICVLQTPQIPFPPKTTPPDTPPDTRTQGARTPNRTKYLTSMVRDNHLTCLLIHHLVYFSLCV